MKIFKYFIYIIVLSFISLSFFTKCANKVPPSGGLRDTIPPNLIYSNPKHQSKNTHTRVYEFTFDEKIQLKNLQKQLIITPRIDFDYEVKQSKKSFFLIFDENFADSVTYTFNFREAIQDLTEGNPTKDNKFTFSTGTEIDSLFIEGYAINLLSNDSIEEATVGLYNIEDTTTIYNGSPYYFAETDEFGYYKIENIKNGKYKLYGFLDGNTNLLLDSKTEAYAFQTDTIILEKNLQNQNLYFQTLDFRELKKLSALPSGKNFDINYNKTLIDFKVIPLHRKIKIYANLAKENKSIRIYQTFDNQDSTGLQVTSIDSIKNNIIDTVWVKFNESQRKPEVFTLTISPSDNSEITENFIGELKINKPLLKINADSIFFKYDTIPISFINKKEQILTNNHVNEFRILFKINKSKIDSIKIVRDSISAHLAQLELDSLEQEKSTEEIPSPKKTVSQQTQKKKNSTGLHLYLGKSAFISAENDSTETTIVNYKFLKQEEYGTIKGKISSNTHTCILQLLNTKNSIVKEIRTKDTFEFKNIKPGDYRIRILVDENDNNIWDYGNIKKHEAPEPVHFYFTPEGKKYFTVRANWVMTDIIIEL